MMPQGTCPTLDTSADATLTELATKAGFIKLHGEPMDVDPPVDTVNTSNIESGGTQEQEEPPAGSGSANTLVNQPSSNQPTNTGNDESLSCPTNPGDGGGEELSEEENQEPMAAEENEDHDEQPPPLAAKNPDNGSTISKSISGPRSHDPNGQEVIQKLPANESTDVLTDRPQQTQPAIEQVTEPVVESSDEVAAGTPTSNTEETESKPSVLDFDLSNLDRGTNGTKEPEVATTPWPVITVTAAPELEAPKPETACMPPPLPAPIPNTISVATHDKINANAEQIKHIKTEVPEGSSRQANALATLASAALRCDQAAINGLKSEVKTASSTVSSVWCDVGIIKGTNATVTKFFEPQSVPDSEHMELTLNNVPDYANFINVDLEPGTAYKFRVAAINTCGRGPWSNVSAFKTSLPGFPEAPTAIKILKLADGVSLSWEPPPGSSGKIILYSVSLAVRDDSQDRVVKTVSSTPTQLTFVAVYSGPVNRVVLPYSTLAAAHIDVTTKPAIIFRIAAKNDKGYGPAIQVRWFQDVVASPSGVTKSSH